MAQPAVTKHAKPMTRGEAEAILRRLQDEAARRSEGLSEQEKDTLADAAARELKDGLNARHGARPKD